MKSFPLLRRIQFDGLLFLCNRVVAHIPSHAFRKFFYRSVMKFEIGEKSFIFCRAHFDTRAAFRMGRHSTINAECRLDNRGGITIGDNVSISAQVCILTADHDPGSRTFVGRERAVRIEDHAFVGTRAMILPGTTIGRGAVVAAGAIVTKDVSPLAIVAGSPAKEIGRREPTLDYQVDYCRLFA
jgi:maltose O-acetyltransferase